MLIKYFSSSSLNVCVWLLRNINFPLPWKLAFPYTFLHSFLLLLSSHVWLCGYGSPSRSVLFYTTRNFFYCQKWNFFRTLKRQTNNKGKKGKVSLRKAKVNFGVKEKILEWCCRKFPVSSYVSLAIIKRITKSIDNFSSNYFFHFLSFWYCL